MRRVDGRVQVAACMIALSACSFPPPEDLPADGSLADGGPTDAPLDAEPLDAASPEFLSCARAPTTCGEAGDQSCCTSLDVPAGSFYRSYDLAGSSSGDTSAPATVSRFRLDKYEVTVGRFRAFVNAGMGVQASAPPAGAGSHVHTPGSGWEASWDTLLEASTSALIAAVKCDAPFETWTDLPAANERRPMNCVTWFEAMTFCIWDGGYLPTEAEWNYAAAGGDEQRAYPWSSPAGSLVLDGSHASYQDDAGHCFGDGVADCDVTDLVAVGTKPLGDGRWGQSDLAGNVIEWNLDWQTLPYFIPCTDCAVVAGGATRVIRGGSFFNSPSLLRTGERSRVAPTTRTPRYGVRCARP